MEAAKNAKKFVPRLDYVRVTSVYDGDTITVVRRRFGVFCRTRIDEFKVRLHGIDCPELRSKDPEEKEIALFVKQHLTNMILGEVVELKVHGYDKYGRLLAKASYRGVDISEHLLQCGFAVPYNGKTKEPTAWKDLLKTKNPDALKDIVTV